MRRALTIIALFLLGGGVAIAVADTLTLKNGDRMNGSLVEIAEDVVVFRANLAGKMMVPVGQVVSVTTASDFVVEFKDGTRATGRVVNQDGGLKFVESQTDKSRPMKVSDIANAARVPETPEGGEGPLGFLEAGVASRFGNRDYVALYARLRTRYDSDSLYYRGDTTIDFAGEGQEPEALRSLHQFILPLEGRLRPLFELELERDLDEALALRARIGAGASVTLLDGERDTLEGRLGLSALHEEYDADAWRALDILPEDGFARLRGRVYGAALDDEDRDDVGLDLALTHSRRVFRDSLLEEELRLRPSLTDFDEFTSSYESRLSVPLTDRLHLKLNMRVDFDNRPQFQYMNEWRAAVGAGISWDF
ncbi:MAG: DUF481 domain-containing protein [Candidatus Hydrogenedentes bacterium]|nr:DUF481 domain-containing protein [Candidatus Hydrogenedentota bacterium]